MPLQISISNSIGGGGGSQGGAPTPAYSNEYSFLFDGVDDYVDMGNPVGLQIIGALTLSVWVNTSLADSNKIIMKDDNTNRCYSLGLRPTSYLVRFGVFNGGSFTSVSSTSTIHDGNWHHLLAVFNPSTSMKIYVDGVLEATNTTSIPSTIDNDVANFNLGRRGDNTSLWSGKIDEVGVFNTDQSANASTIYNSGVPNDISAMSGLVSWWRMGENATWDGVRDWTLVDQGSGGNDGLTQNMAQASRVNDVPPNFNINSFLFDGVDDIFEGSSIYSEMNGGTKLTLSVWLKPISGAPTLEYALSNPRDTTANNSQFALILYEGNSVQFNVQGFNSQYVSGRIGAVTYGAWNHILICVDLSRTIGTEGIMFINGVDETTTSAMGTLSSFYTATDVLHIGVDANGGYNRFNGNIDELAIWSGSDLRSASDVSSIYNSGVPSDLNDTSGIAVPTTYFRMGEQSTFSSQWSMTDINGSYAVTSSNMVLASRTTDIP